MDKESLSCSVICSFILTQAILVIKSCSLLLTQGETLNQGTLLHWPPAERLYTKAPYCVPLVTGSTPRRGCTQRANTMSRVGSGSWQGCIVMTLLKLQLTLLTAVQGQARITGQLQISNQRIPGPLILFCQAAMFIIDHLNVRHNSLLWMNIILFPELLVNWRPCKHQCVT